MIESLEPPGFNNRILICDDNKSIHDDLSKIFQPPPRSHNEGLIRSLEHQLFDNPEEVATAERVRLNFQIDSAFSSREAIKMTQQARREGFPYALIFMDVRMPPGDDGIKTIKQIWRTMPETEMVLLTAYSDYSWEQIIATLGINDKLLYLRKPFSSIAVKQIALNLINKWNSNEKLRQRISELETRLQAS